MIDAPLTEPGAPEQLVAMRAEPGRATLAAVSMVLVTDAGVLAAGAVLRLIGPQSDPIRGAVFAAVVASAYFAGLGVAIAITRCKDHSFADDYGFRGLTVSDLGWALLAAVAVRAAGGLWSLALIALKIKLPGMDLDPTSVLPKDPLSVALAFVLFAGIAPFVEEVGFRGIMFGSLSRRMRPWSANLLSSALFAAMHFNLFGMVPIFISSVAFAWLFQRTRSLWTAVFAHAAFNGIGLALAYMTLGKGSL